MYKVNHYIFDSTMHSLTFCLCVPSPATQQLSSSSSSSTSTPLLLPSITATTLNPSSPAPHYCHPLFIPNNCHVIMCIPEVQQNIQCRTKKIQTCIALLFSTYFFNCFKAATLLIGSCALKERTVSKEETNRDVM